MSETLLRAGADAGGFHVMLAASAEDLAAAYRLRHQVFCVEQRLFQDDRDDIDPVAATIVAASEDGEVIGTVRIHQPEPALWFGSRLAVAASWRRRAGLGAALIRAAVSTAHGRGCRRFLAHVQAQNAGMFEALHWQTLENCTLHGMPHCLMQADLASYPAAASLDADRTGAAA